jgi:hypothetical protein
VTRSGGDVAAPSLATTASSSGRILLSAGALVAVEHVSCVGRGRCWQTEGAPSDETGAPSAACTAKGSTVKEDAVCAGAHQGGCWVRALRATNHGAITDRQRQKGTQVCEETPWYPDQGQEEDLGARRRVTEALNVHHGSVHVKGASATLPRS